MKENREKKIKKPSFFKIIILFLAFEFVFSAVTMPFLIFYGPFDNVKRQLVGAAMNTLRHQYIAKIFLSDLAIYRILADYVVVDPTANGVEVSVINFQNNDTDMTKLYTIDGGSFKGKMLEIYDPKRVVVGYSAQMPKTGETTSAIAKRNNAIAAINAGGFGDIGMTGTGGIPMGIIIHNGKVVHTDYKNENAEIAGVTAITDSGMLIIGQQTIAQLKKKGVKEAINFGPTLVVNGKPTISRGDGGFGTAPRTAIGQTADGKILFLVIDGRRFGSVGATLRDVQDIMLEFKAVNAVNLDGGSSTTMFYNGKVINNPSDALGERTVPTVFMVLPERGSD